MQQNRLARTYAAAACEMLPRLGVFRHSAGRLYGTAGRRRPCLRSGSPCSSVRTGEQAEVCSITGRKPLFRKPKGACPPSAATADLAIKQAAKAIRRHAGIRICLFRQEKPSPSISKPSLKPALPQRRRSGCNTVIHTALGASPGAAKSGSLNAAQIVAVVLSVLYH